ncbi:type II toxin-antitoxin system PemK/MazF family toxin [Microvirga massiliensis]|uniref:type II toxin-antitoxin system PemK/MazF family toxin n=1 Tax=Microvirga massiliensis TaxID=1033741 RepID=UPI00062BEB06|nr:type II toxin-antitoxin system PemK/MazF family toxin [Microvirga massiliensis]
MHDFEFGDVIRVPFPYTDRNTRQRRPAFVVSAGRVGEGRSLLWVLMITSAENCPWIGDVTFGDNYAVSGLPAPSVVRTTKIATIEASHAERIGKAPEQLANAVTQEVKAILNY